MNATSLPASFADTNTAVSIRPFAESDYEAALAAEMIVWPDFPETAAEWRFQDECRDPKCHHARFVAEITLKSGTKSLIGYAYYEQRVDMYHPR